MRPMFQEFDDEVELLKVSSQYMVGGSILFAPKTIHSTSEQIKREVQPVQFYLPSSATWYRYTTKLREIQTGTGFWRSEELTDSEQALFIKGGSIIPKLIHDYFSINCAALLTCIRE